MDHEAIDKELYKKILSFSWYIEARGTKKDGKPKNSDFTGFSVDKDLIVTCAHGLSNIVKNLKIKAQILSGEERSSYKVELGDGFKELNLVSMEPELDLALLKLVELDKNQAVAEFGDGELNVGQKVVHVGNVEGAFRASYLIGNVAFKCTSDVVLPMDNQKCCEFDLTVSDKWLPYRIFGHTFNRHYDWEVDSDLVDSTKTMHPLLPIIQINRMRGGQGCSGGLLCDTQGRVVGLLFRRFNYDMAIHVSMIKEFVRRGLSTSEACCQSERP